jgi:hypothetical protein
VPRAVHRLLLIAALFALPAAPRDALAQWPHDPAAGLKVANAPAFNPTSLPDGSGGMFLVWLSSGANDFDVWAQHISNTGAPLWSAAGVAVCTLPGAQYPVVATLDRQGGIVIAWQDQRSALTAIYAQRLNAAGTPQWPANGLAVATPAGGATAPTLAADGSGGAWIAWQDQRTSATTGYDIYMQHVFSGGSTQFPANGTAVCNLATDQKLPAIACETSGNTVTVAWMDSRTPANNTDIYAQVYNGSSGTPYYAVNGTAICTAANVQANPRVFAFDHSGACWIVWDDQRSGVNLPYVQSLTTSSAQLGLNGAPATGSATSLVLQLASGDGTGGLLLAMQNVASDLQVQRLAWTGALMWGTNGVVIANDVGLQTATTIVPDGTGGAVFGWIDGRVYQGLIAAQRVSAAGAIQWATGGVIVGAGGPDWRYTVTGQPDGNGGYLLVYLDDHTGIGALAELDGKDVDRWGYMGAVPVMLDVRDVPNDNGGKVKVSWSASPLDTDPNFFNVADYLVFRSAPPNAPALAARAGRAVVALEDYDPARDAGALVVSRSGAATYAWEQVAQVTANHLATYGVVAPTTGDSMGIGNPLTAFMVHARGTTANQFWDSAPDSGYSTDNVPPIAPAPFSGTYSAGTALLHWNPNPEADLANYRLYRGPAPGFVPGPGTLVAAPADTGFVDAAGAVYWYKLTAVDVHGNESAPTALLPAGTLGVGEGAPRELALSAPAPNPTRGSARITLSLPRAGHVSLELLDTAGRRVRTLVDGDRAAGRWNEAVDLRDDAGRPLRAGLYLVRLEAGGRTLTRRVVAVR